MHFLFHLIKSFPKTEDHFWGLDLSIEKQYWWIEIISGQLKLIQNFTGIINHK
jgi:hypothetical protein